MSPTRAAPPLKRRVNTVLVQSNQAREAIRSAVMIAGGPAEVARIFGYKKSASVIFWYSDKSPDRGIDPIVVRQLAKLCDYRVGAAEMLPEVFGGLTKRELGAPIAK